MAFARAFRHAWLFALILVHKAGADCVGDTTTYSESGLVVPFKNLCNQDISAPVDFGDPTNEPSRTACFTRCVQKAPLCYGFDFTEDQPTGMNCWLMRGYFTANQTTASGNVDAAMLDPDFLSALSGECIQLGIYGCWKKNGRVGTAVASSSASSLASTSTASTASAAATNGSGGNTSTSSLSGSGSGLSTGAKAGIGAGIGIAALLAIIAAVLFLLRRRKRNNIAQVSYADGVQPTEKYAARAHPHRIGELPAHDTQYPAELESPEAVNNRSRDAGLVTSMRQ